VVRSVQGCELTDFGRTLLERAESIERAMSGLAELDGPSASRPSIYSGLVRVLAPEGFGACFVAPVLARMHKNVAAVEVMRRISEEVVARRAELWPDRPISER
jgi:DNA-binding transcriptional LysR family regulator